MRKVRTRLKTLVVGKQQLRTREGCQESGQGRDDDSLNTKILLATKNRVRNAVVTSRKAKSPKVGNGLSGARKQLDSHSVALSGGFVIRT